MLITQFCAVLFNFMYPGKYQEHNHEKVFNSIDTCTWIIHKDQNICPSVLYISKNIRLWVISTHPIHFWQWRGRPKSRFCTGDKTRQNAFFPYSVILESVFGDEWVVGWPWLMHHWIRRGRKCGGRRSFRNICQSWAFFTFWKFELEFEHSS